MQCISINIFLWNALSCIWIRSHSTEFLSIKCRTQYDGVYWVQDKMHKFDITTRTHSFFSIILLYSLYILTVVHDRTQTDYFADIRGKWNKIYNKRDILGTLKPFAQQRYLWNSQNCSMFPLAFVAGWLQGHWWGFISRNYVVWPTFLLMNVFIALKGSYFWLSFNMKKATRVWIDISLFVL